MASPPPLSFGSAPPSAPPLSFGTSESTQPAAHPAPLAFGVTRAAPSVPFDATLPGIVKNTFDPLSLIQAAAHVGQSIIQAGASTALAIPASIVQLFDPSRKGVAIPAGFMQRLTGETTQQSFQEMAGHAAADEPYPAEGLVGTLANPLAKFFATNPTAQRLGLDKAAPLLAVGSVIGDSFLNLAGFNDLGAEGKLISQLVKETIPERVGTLLRQHGIDPAIADKFAPEIADLRNAKDVEGALKTATALQHTQDTSEALHPGVARRVGDEYVPGPGDAEMHDLPPEAATDWQQNYEPRHTEIAAEIAALDERAKSLPELHAMVLTRERQPLVAEQAALEDAFMKKWVPESVPKPGELPVPTRVVARPPEPSTDLQSLTEKTAGMKLASADKAYAKLEQTGSAIIGEKDGLRLVIKDEGDFVRLGLDTGSLSSTDEALPSRTFATKEEAFTALRPLYERALAETQKPKGAAAEFKVGDRLDPQGNTNMKGVVTIREVKGNTLHFTDSKGTEFSGMARSTVRDLIKGGSWKRAEEAPRTTPATPEAAAQTYWDAKIASKAQDGKAIVIGADDLKDYFGGDYNDENHPIYSRAAFLLYERALKESKGDSVVFTGGGAGSGKTEVIVKDLLARDFDGIVYDSNMANYDGVVKQIEMAKAAGKDAVVYGILPNLESARVFTILREQATGRGISDKTFARGHAGFPAVTKKLLDNGILAPKDVNILDVRTPTKLDEVKAMAARGDYAKDPVALLGKVQYNEDTLRGKYGKERFTTNVEGASNSRGVAQEQGDLDSGGRAPDEGGPDTAAGGAGGQDRGGSAPVSRTVLQRPQDLGIISEEQSLDAAAQAHEEWKYELYGGTAEDKSADDLTQIFADLKGVKAADLKEILTPEELVDARTNFKIGQETLLDHPGRALMKYVSRETGDLPELGSKETANKNFSKSAFRRAGDVLFQDLLGQEASGGGDVARAQELVDDYRALKARVDEAEANFKNIRTTIRLQKEAGTFVASARRAIASKVATDTKALRNLIQSAERAGYQRGTSEASAAGKAELDQMIEKLKGRREKIEALQTEYNLRDRQMQKIMGRRDPRFMNTASFNKYYQGLAERAARARASLDRYGPMVAPGDVLLDGTKGPDGGSWTALIKNYQRNLGSKAKVDFVDYLGTPEYVLERLGLGKAAEMLHDAQDVYRITKTAELEKVAAWKARAGGRPQSTVRIFRYLDGQERFVKEEMSPQELEVAREIRGYLKAWADRLNLPDDNRIARYITHLFEPGEKAVAEGASMFDDPDLAQIMQNKVAGSVYDPFLEQRLGKRGYKEDVWAALDAYVKRAARKEAMDPVLEHMVDEAAGLDHSAYKYVSDLSHRINMRPTDTDKLIDNFIKYRMKVTRYGDRPIAYISQKLRSGFYLGTIGLNFASALRNLSQGANNYAKLGEMHTIIGYTKIAWQLARGDLSEIMHSGILGDAYVQDRKMGVYKTLLQKLDPAIFALFDTAEKINRGAAYYGAKSKYWAENANVAGASEEQAVKYAKRIVRETQFAFSNVDTPVALASDITKTLAQLQTYNIKQIEFLGRMLRNKEFAGLARYSVASLAFVYTIGRMFGMNLGQLLPSVSITGSPAASSLSAAYDYLFGDERAKARGAGHLQSAVFSRIPGGIQIFKKTIPGLEAVNRGKDVTATGKTRYTIPRTIGNYIKAGFFGKSSLDEAQQYYDSLGKKKPAAAIPPL